MIEQTAITKKFIIEYNELVKSGKIHKQTEFTKRIGYNITSLSNVLAGRRNLPHYVYSKFQEVYDLKPKDQQKNDETYKEKYFNLMESYIENLKRMEQIHKELTEIKALLIENPKRNITSN